MAVGDSNEEKVDRDRERTRALEREEIRTYVEHHKDDLPLSGPVGRVGERVAPVPTPEEQEEMERQRDADLARLAEYEQREIERKARERWISSGIPERARLFAEEHADGPPAPADRAYRDLREAVANSMTAVLIGVWGTGKTCLAACVVRAETSRGKRALYVRAVDLVDEVNETYGANARRSKREVIDRYCTVDLLVIDEEHERRRSEDADRSLHRILDGRYSDNRPTILITNESLEAVSESIGPAIVSRIHEAGLVIDCDWPSFRRAARQKTGGSS